MKLVVVIPALDEAFVTAERVHWLKGQIPDPELPLFRRLYEEYLVPAPAEVADGLEQLLTAGEAGTVVRTTDGLRTVLSGGVREVKA